MQTTIVIQPLSGVSPTMCAVIHPARQPSNASNEACTGDLGWSRWNRRRPKRDCDWVHTFHLMRYCTMGRFWSMSVSSLMPSTSLNVCDLAL